MSLRWYQDWHPPSPQHERRRGNLGSEKEDTCLRPHGKWDRKSRQPTYGRTWVRSCKNQRTREGARRLVVGVKVETSGLHVGSTLLTWYQKVSLSMGTWTSSRASPGLSFPVWTWRNVLATLFWGALSPPMPSSSCLKPANTRGQQTPKHFKCGVVACSGHMGSPLRLDIARVLLLQDSEACAARHSAVTVERL